MESQRTVGSRVPLSLSGDAVLSPTGNTLALQKIEARASDERQSVLSGDTVATRELRHEHSLKPLPMRPEMREMARARSCERETRRAAIARIGAAHDESSTFERRHRAAHLRR